MVYRIADAGRLKTAAEKIKIKTLRNTILVSSSIHDDLGLYLYFHSTLKRLRVVVFWMYWDHAMIKEARKAMIKIGMIIAWAKEVVAMGLGGNARGSWGS
jgi:hypothetical protein